MDPTEVLPVSLNINGFLSSHVRSIPVEIRVNNIPGDNRLCEYEFVSTAADCIGTISENHIPLQTTSDHASESSASNDEHKTHSRTYGGDDFLVCPAHTSAFADGSDIEESFDSEESAVGKKHPHSATDHGDREVDTPSGETQGSENPDVNNDDNDEPHSDGSDGSCYDGDISQNPASDDGVPSIFYHDISDSDSWEFDDEPSLLSGKKPEPVPIWVQYPKGKYPRFDLGIKPTESNGTEAVLASRAYPMPEPGSVAKQVWVIVSTDSSWSDSEDEDDEMPVEYFNHS